MNVNEYLRRIGLKSEDLTVPDSDSLARLQYAHCTRVPYENLDILRGIPLSLDTEKLYEKIVIRQRGGYCFELNGLFGALLRELGYGVSDLAARYLRGESRIPMRRHRVLKVTATDGLWICDVGIGEACPRYPLRLAEGLVQKQFDEKYRFEKNRELGWILTEEHHGEWRPFYSFTEEEQRNEDYIALSFYCEKHPDSPFTGQEMFSLKTAEGRVTLDGSIFKEFRFGEVTVKELSEAELPAAYARFGLSY